MIDNNRLDSAARQARHHIQQQEMAVKFCTDNLQDLCIEVMEWSKMGTLPLVSKLRALAEMYTREYAGLRLAQAEVEFQAVKYVASNPRKIEAK